MSAPRTTAVFLSYAHEDAPSAQRFARALRDAGIEVWLDENELRGGEAWDQKIRRQIRDCALFVPVISANTQARREGYFRLEWRLAVERMRHMDDDLAFLVPLVIDGTPNARAFVPDEFHTVQWTRLPDGTATPAVIEQVRRLLAGPTHAPFSAPRSDLQISPGPTRRVPWRRWLAAAVIITIAAAASVAIWWRAGRRHPPPATPTPAPAAVSDPRSIAVLPFENLSTGPDTVYFADGMHEEVLTALAKVSSLKVIARTSVLRYADPRTRDLGRIAADLNVANVLEGSVRHSGNKVRIAVQLVDARTSRQLWASTYERELTDVFAIQAAIAQEITATLQAALTPGERSRLEQRPTANPEAYELYLRAMSALHDLGTPSLASREKIEAVLALFERAAAADPQFALPLVQLAQLHGYLYWFGIFDPTPARAQRAIAIADALRRLAPDAPETHQALGAVLYQCRNDWEGALQEFRLARPGLPNDSRVFQWEGFALRRLGRWNEARASFENSLLIEPQNAFTAESLVETVRFMRRYADAVKLGTGFMARLSPSPSLTFDRAAAQLALDDDPAAYLRALQTQPGEAGYSRRHVWDALLLAGAYQDAAAFLTAGNRTQLSSLGAVVNDPVDLYQAELAWLQGNPAAARAPAAAARAYYERREWSARQRPFVAAGAAMAAALAGDASRARALAAESRRLLDAAPDAFNAAFLPAILGPAFIVLGDHDAAFAELHQMMSSAGDSSPASIRHDPFWSRLATDPRFAATLAEARPL